MGRGASSEAGLYYGKNYEEGHGRVYNGFVTVTLFELSVQKELAESKRSLPLLISIRWFRDISACSAQAALNQRGGVNAYG